MNQNLVVTWTDDDGIESSMPYHELIALADEGWQIVVDEAWPDGDETQDAVIDAIVDLHMAALELELSYLHITPTRRFLRMGRRGSNGPR